jgi:CubicO group peptidase (beta-lactamase class C family)
LSRSLELIRGWPATAAAAWAHGGRLDSEGPTDRLFPWASVTKVLTALAVWIAVEEGTVGWEDPAGPPGSTLAHLLSHASGLAPDSDEVLAPPGARRIYSNRGFEIAADHLGSAAGAPFESYVREAVLEPLGMFSTTVGGSPASGASGPLTDLMLLGGELATPRLVAAVTLEHVTAVSFPGLAGVLPGFGRLAPNDWGLGIEVRDRKHPHWTGSLNSPHTFGHFGRSGSFVWVDPAAGVLLAALGDAPFGAWATTAWPQISDAVLREIGSEGA